MNSFLAMNEFLSSKTSTDLLIFKGIDGFGSSGSSLAFRVCFHCDSPTFAHHVCVWTGHTRLV